MKAKQFKSIREKHGLTQMQLAKLFGQTRNSTISRWENGQRKIPVFAQTIMRFLENCKCGLLDKKALD